LELQLGHSSSAPTQTPPATPVWTNLITGAVISIVQHCFTLHQLYPAGKPTEPLSVPFHGTSPEQVIFVFPDH
jgi:hypothetical protein